MSKHRRYPLTWALLATSVALAAPTAATELVYYPFNPSFGGNPLNGSVLLNSALATSKHTDPDIDERGGIEEKTALETFNETLERSILSRLAASASSQIIGPDGQFVPGTMETESFTITVADSGGGYLTITTTDRVTGDFTEFQVTR